MSEKRINNTIFLMYIATENYCRKYHISTEDFLKLDEKYAILNYIAECPDIFDSLTICAAGLIQFCTMEQFRKYKE